MPNVPNVPNDAITNAINEARKHLSPQEAQKLEALTKNKQALGALTANLSDNDWAKVLHVMNNPELLRSVLSSPKGKAGLGEILKRMK